MIKSSSGQELSIGKLRALLMSGGDTTATISDNSDTSAATRGSHLLIKYQAPLEDYYRQWHLRALKGYSNWADGVASSNMLLHDRVLASGVAASSTANDIAASTASALLDVTKAHCGNTLPDFTTRRVHVSTLLVMDAVGFNHTLARARYDADTAEVSTRRDSIIKLYQAAGKAAADTIGQGVSSAQQVVELKAGERQYNTAVAKFKSTQDIAAAEDRAARRAAQGKLLGAVARVGLKIATGGAL